MVVAVGATSLVPELVTGPMPWSMETAVAPFTFHCRVADLPAVIAEGSEVNEDMTGKLLPPDFSKNFPFVARASPIPAITTSNTIITIPILPSDFAFPPGLAPR